MKVIYTIKNPETRDAYVWYTNSLSTRLTQHIANWLFVLLQIPTTMPLFIVLNMWKAIIDVFIAWDDYRWDEIRHISKTRWDGRNMINKTKWGNWR